MSLTEEQVTAKNFQEFYTKIRPYLNGSFPTPIVNKFSKGDLYSTDEKIIGQWTDGKPIWQKVFTVNQTVSTGSWVSVADTSSLNIDNLIFVNAQGTYDVFMGSLINLDCAQFGLTSNKNNIQTFASRNTSFYLGTLTAQYTKTTDSPISIGDGNDYSTDEQVVGTWIDGKPVYQKTITGLSAQLNWNQQFQTTAQITKPIANVGNYVRCEGYTSNGRCISLAAVETGGNLKLVGFEDFLITQLTLQYTKSTD